MNFFKLFIQRPIATLTAMMALLLAGGIAYFYLPISDLPNIDFPTILVSANMPGADPETMATSITRPLEKALGTVSGIDSMNSTSTTGSTKIILQFSLTRNINAAAEDVQSTISQISRQLPSQMSSPPTIRKLNPAQSPILYLALTSDHVPMTTLDDFAENYLSPNLSMIQGVANVEIFGSQQYAVRIHLNPNALKNRDLSLTEVKEAVQQLNSNQATGTIQTDGFYHLIKADGGLKNAKQFNDAIIAVKEGRPIYLKEVATVKDSVANDKAITWYNNDKAIVLAIQRQDNSNTVAVVNAILHDLPQLSQQIPGGGKLRVVYNRANYIKDSIHDIQFTLMFAMLLVAAVLFLFFNSFSLTVIAALSLPISVIATFFVMYFFNYSLDNLSLMGLVLALGFVIDDTIVVIENIVRYIEQGMSQIKASLQALSEVGFTVLVMTISLAAVFIPIFFMGGIIGKLFHEFSAVVTISISFSAIVAVTFIPVLCSHFCKKRSFGESKPSKFNVVFSKFHSSYKTSLKWSLENYSILLWGSAVLIILSVLLFYWLPKGFIPSQDSGIIYGGIEAPEGITYPNFLYEENSLKKIILQNPNVSAVITSIAQGADASASANSGRLIIKLKPSSKRRLSTDQVIQQLKHQLKPVAGLKIFLTNPPAIQIGGKSSNSNYQYVLQSLNWDSLRQAASTMQEKLSHINGVTAVDSDLQVNNPELKLHILRAKAAVLGVTPEQIESTLYSAYGQEQVSSLMRADGDYEVIMDVDPKYQKNSSSLNSLYLKSSTGDMVPLSNLVTVSTSAAPLSVSHYNQLPAVTLSFNLQSGYALGQVVNQVRSVAEHSLPHNVTGHFVGVAEKFQQSLTTLPFLLLLTVIVIYMVLAILYESFIHPLTILTALPFAAFGALLSLYLLGQQLDLFSFIGLIMLVGITKKNGIIMVDFALDAMRSKKITAKEAILEACGIRFRPIMLTTFCAIITALPIASGIGAGGESRQGLGIAVVGGLIFSQIITLYITPIFYMLMDKWFAKRLEH